MKDKETKKLGGEDLTKRVAPLATPIYTEVPDDPTTGPTSGGGGGGQTGSGQEDVKLVDRKPPFPKSNP